MRHSRFLSQNLPQSGFDLRIDGALMNEELERRIVEAAQSILHVVRSSFLGGEGRGVLWLDVDAKTVGAVGLLVRVEIRGQLPFGVNGMLDDDRASRRVFISNCVSHELMLFRCANHYAAGNARPCEFPRFHSAARFNLHRKINGIGNQAPLAGLDRLHDPFSAKCSAV